MPMSPMSPHAGDPRCVCTDGREAERDTSKLCQAGRDETKPRPSKIVPQYTLVTDGGAIYPCEPVTGVVAYPPGAHPNKCPIVASMTAVELQTRRGSRWYGFERAYIGSDLKMHVEGWDARNEIVRAWADGKADPRADGAE